MEPGGNRCATAPDDAFFNSWNCQRTPSAAYPPGDVTLRTGANCASSGIPWRIYIQLSSKVKREEVERTETGSLGEWQVGVLKINLAR
jgi:hypothetical protein